MTSTIEKAQNAMTELCGKISIGFHSVGTDSVLPALRNNPSDVVIMLAYIRCFDAHGHGSRHSFELATLLISRTRLSSLSLTFSHILSLSQFGFCRM